MNKEDIKELADNMLVIRPEIPDGFSQLHNALSFAIMDLTTYYQYGIECDSLPQAIEFAKSIPVFEDFNSDEFNSWLINDKAYIDYVPF